MARIFSWKVSPTKYAYLIKYADFGTDESCIRSRITDVSQLRQMADMCNELTEAQYEEKYNAVKAEVNATEGLWKMVNSYHDYYDASTGGYSDVVILSGVGPEGEYDGSWEGGDSDAKWRELEEYIDSLMEEYRSRISADTAAIKEAIAEAASSDIGAAMNALVSASTRLDEIEAELAAAAADAQSALDAARDLIGLGADGITPQAIANVIQSTNRYDEWLNQNGSATTQMIADYDALRDRMGGIGTAVDVAGGYLSYLGYSMNLLSGTVGTAERTMAALSGTILDQTTWYDETQQSMAEMGQRISAMSGTITQYGSYMEGLSGGMVNYVNQQIDAKGASITQELYHRLSGTNENLTSIRSEMNAISGYVRTEITRMNGSLNTVTGNITTIHTDMNALNGRLTTAMTIAQSALTQATDMRETWSRESGMLRTVADLVVRTDENGDPIFYYVGASGMDKTRVYKMEGLKNGLPYYNTKKDGSGIEYVEDVIPDYLTQMMSYVQQTVSSITFEVTSGDVIAAMRLEVTHEGQAIIYGLADEIRLDAKVIANSLSAKTANIGGIEIGRGNIIYTGTNNQNYYKLLSNGKLQARNAEIFGSISAETGYFKGGLCAATGTFKGKLEAASGSFKGAVSADTGYFKGGLCAATGTFKGKLEAATGSFNGAVTANSLTLGSGAYGDLNTWINGKGYTTTGGVQNQISNYLATNGYATEDEAAQIAANAIANGISFVETSTTTNGVTKHIAHIGNNTYDWYTIDTGDYLILDAWRGSSDHTKSGVCISTNGLLQANNAIIYGKIYASEGEFKGALTANSLTLTSQAQTPINNLITAATNGLASQQYVNNKVNGLITADEATGLIQAQAGTAAEQALANSTGFVRVDKWMSAGTGDNKTAFFVSRNGLLQAQNAIISGSVYATNGYFSGEISAADIKLNGKSLVLNDSASNTFEIGNQEIEVNYVPLSIDVTEVYEEILNQSTFHINTEGDNWDDGVYFEATGDTATFTIPAQTWQVTTTYIGSDSMRTINYHLQAMTTLYWMDSGRLVFVASAGQETQVYYQNVDYGGGGTTYIESPAFTASTTNKKHYCVQVTLDGDPGYVNNVKLVVVKSRTPILIPASAEDNAAFFRIGKNGMQIFLGEGFSFTAARRKIYGDNYEPIIVIAGKVSGSMKMVKMDKSGLQIIQ